MPGRHHRNIFASPIGRATPNDVYAQQAHLHTASCQTLSRGSEYCACHTDRSRGPAATRRAATLSATQTEADRDQRRPGAPQPFLEALSTAPATQTGAADQRRPGAPQPFLEALSTAPATQTGAADQRRPRAPRSSEYCACHTDRSLRLPDMYVWCGCEMKPCVMMMWWRCTCVRWWCDVMWCDKHVWGWCDDHVWW